MTRHRLAPCVASLVLLLAVATGLVSAQGPAPKPAWSAQAAPLGSAFTYQGQLKSNGEALSATCSMAFSLYGGADPAAALVGGPITVTVPVTAGLFTASLDFGSSSFDGQARWLEIAVDCPAGAGFVTLGRQALTAVPYALYATTAASATTALTATTAITATTAGFATAAIAATTADLATTAITATTADLATAALTATTALSASSAPWSGLTGVPAGFADNVDDGTTYSSGFGLSLSGYEFSVNPDAVQVRVGGPCTPGSAIRGINADGSVICQSDASFNRSAVPLANALSTLDGQDNVGQYSSITIGADGLGLISYYDSTNGNLKVAHCDDAACASAAIASLDSAGDVGQYASITIGADGLGLISYYDLTSGDLKVAHCQDVACSSATAAAVDTGGTSNVGQYTSITIGSDGLGLISYYDQSNGNLKAAHCNDAACATATFATPDEAGNVGQHTAVTVGADGLGIISYYDGSNSLWNLMVAHCSNPACTVSTKTMPASSGNVGEFTSITIGADGLPLISYLDRSNGDLKAVHCQDAACTTFTSILLDSGGTSDVGLHTSITMGADGLALITYYDDTLKDLKAARCRDVACSSAAVTTVDSAGTVGQYTSVTIGADGLPLISYYDGTNGDLKVAHCSNGFCVPYFRRR